MSIKNEDKKTFWQKLFGLKTKKEKTNEFVKKKFNEIAKLNKQKLIIEEEIVKMAKLKFENGKLVLDNNMVEQPQAPMPQAPMPQAPMPQAPMPQAPMPQAPMPQAPMPNPFEEQTPSQEQFKMQMKENNEAQHECFSVKLNLIDGRQLELNDIPFQNLELITNDLSKAIDEQAIFVINQTHRINGRHIIDFEFE